ncbi:MAG: anti-sigma factor family protein [Parahaliea sp.]
MTDQDYELLSQYIDGELDAAASARLEQRLAEDASLAVQLHRMQRIDETLRTLAGRQGGEAPPRIAALLNSGSTDRARVLPFPNRRRRIATGFALAASLMVAAGLTLAPQWQGHGSRDQLVARALENTPSSDEQWHILKDGSRLRPLLTFATENGSWCREYQVSDKALYWHGVACRGDRGWQGEILVTVEEHAVSATDYIPAGIAETQAIADYINKRLADIPLSAAEEAILIQARWRQ